MGVIAVLMGGISAERNISLRSGQAVARALRDAGFQVVEVDTAQEGALEKLPSLEVDMAFLALHGRGGEDGTVQAFLEERDIPYLGSGPEASRRAFNKIVAKRLFAAIGIPTPRFEVISSVDWEERIASLHFPVFLKPPEEGSSMDVFPAQNRTEAGLLARGLLARYGQVLAEEKAVGREITVGIVGERALPVVEIRPHREFYDYVAKYESGETEYLCPAPLGRPETARAQELALAVHRALGLRDCSRVDMIATPDGPQVLEVNTIPGFTEKSLLPKAASAEGLTFSQLCAELVHIASLRNRNEKESKKAGILAS